MTGEEKINTKINFSSDSFKKYFFNTSWLFSEKILKVVLGFVVVVAVTNYLGAKDFGLYSYALSFTGIFSVIASLGLDNILTRELIKSPEKKKILLGTSFILKISGAFVVLILLVIVLLVIENSTFTRALILILAASTIFQSFFVIEFLFQSQVLAKYPVIVKSLSFFIASGIKLLLIFLNASLIYFVIFTTFEFLILAIGLIIIYFQRGSNIFHWKFDKKLALKLLDDSWPLVLSGLAIGVYMYIDQIMITKMLGESENGSYATAVKLCEAFYFIPMIITSSLFPAIVNAKEVSEKLYLSRLQKLYDLLAWIAMAIAVPVSLLSGFIIQLLYKPEYLPAAPVLAIYIWAGVATFLGVGSSQYLIAENYTKVSFYRTFAGMVANIILNIYLIPAYGINGAAIATLISYSLATFSLFFNKKTKKQTIMMFKSILFINFFNLLFRKWQSH